MWSQICGKNAMLVHKITLKKKCKKVNHKKLKSLKSHFFFKAIFETSKVIVLQI